MSGTKMDEGGDEPIAPKAPAASLPPAKLGMRHAQVLLMFLGMMIAYGLRVHISVAMVAMTDPNSADHFNKKYKWTLDDLALVYSSFFWGYIVTQVPSGYVASIWSGQKLLAGGIAICGFLCLITPFVVDEGGWQAICAIRVGMGLTQGCVLPCIQTLLSKWAPPSERARLGTFAYSGAQLGTVVAMPISGALAASHWGWPSIFFSFGGSGILWAIIFYFWGADSPARHPTISNEEQEYIEDSLQQAPEFTEKRRRIITPWKEIFKSAPMWALIIVHCGQNWGYWILITEMPAYMAGVLKFNIQDNGSISALPYLAMWLLSFPVSWLSDYALKKGVSRGTARKASNTLAHWGPALALLALCLIRTESKVVPVAILILAVALNAGSLCGFQINHIDLSPNFAGTMMSITNCIASVVAIIAPIICGAIVTNTSNVNQWQTVFYISSLIYFLGNLVFIIFGKGEVQWWNNVNESIASSRRNSLRRRSSAATVPTIMTLDTRRKSNVSTHSYK